VPRRKVVFSPEAKADLERLYDYIADNSGPARSLAYIERIEAYCRRFDLVAERGVSRDDIRPGLRSVGFERRVAIAFHVEVRTVTIDRILYGGRDLDRAFGIGEDDR
jgi:toxin ParE1/3/4